MSENKINKNTKNQDEETQSLKTKNSSPSPSNKEEEENNLNELCAKILNISEGLSKFSYLAITYYLKDTLKLSPSKSAFFQSLLGVPSIFSPLFGFISDTILFFGYKRKSYILFNGFLVFITWLILSFFNFSMELTLLLLFINSTSKTFLSSCVNAVWVQLSKKRSKDEKKLENYNSAIIYINIGTIISSLTRGIALTFLSTKTIFLISGMISFLNIIAGILYKETKYNRNENDKKKDINHFKQVFDIIKQKELMLLIIYMLIMTITPSYYESSFYFLTDAKGFSKIDFSNFTLVIMLLFFMNSIINKKYINSFKPTYVVIITTIISFLFSSIYNLWIVFDLQSKIIVFGAISLYVSFKALSVKPIFNLAYLMCPEGYGGSIMGLFYSLRDFGDFLSSIFGSWLSFLFDIQGNKYSNFSIIYFVNDLNDYIERIIK